MPIAPPNNTRNAKTTDSWITPKWLLDQLGPFDLDPCASDPQPWPCAPNQYTEAENGLLQPWRGLVYCNPPYGKTLGAWLNRCALHGDAIALVFARTETKAFFDSVWPFASSLLFIRKRLTFAYPDGSLPRNGANSGGPSVLIGFGPKAEIRLREQSSLGALVKVQK